MGKSVKILLLTLLISSVAVSAFAWSSAVNVSNDPYRAHGPRVCRTSDNYLHMVWNGGHSDSAQWVIKYQFYNGSSWSGTTTLSGIGAGDKDIVCDANNNLYVAWNAGDRIYFRKCISGTWQSTEDIQGSTNKALFPRMAVKSDGTQIYVCWHENSLTNGTYDIVCRIWSGGSWGSRVNVSSDNGLSRYPDVFLDGSGNFHVVWEDTNDYKSYYKMRNSAGTWGAKETVAGVNSSDRAFGPALWVHGSVVHATYHRNGTGNWEQYYKNRNGSWGTELLLYSNPNETDCDGDIVCDPNGNAIVAWSDYKKIYFREQVNGSWQSVQNAITVANSKDPCILLSSNNRRQLFSMSNPGAWQCYWSWQDDPGAPTTGQIAGTVTASGGGAISGATVSTTTGGYTTTTNASGGYTLQGVNPGTYSVVASKTGYNNATNTGVVVTVGNTTTSNFTLTPNTGTISGTVRDTFGNGLSTALVQTTTGGYSVYSGTGGVYTLSNVAAGTYSMTAAKANYDTQTVTGVVVNVGQTTTQDFALVYQYGWIDGYVKDAGGVAISGASVSTTTGGGTATTDANGYYKTNNISPGTYDVVASKTGYNPQTKTGISVTKATTTRCSDFNLSLIAPTGSISGNVKDEFNNNLSGATVSTTTGGYTTTTNASGNYTLSNVNAGTYSVVASQSGYNSATNNGVVVTGGQNTVSNFTLNIVRVERMTNGNMEGGFFNTGWGTNCSGTTSKLPNSYGWNNDASYPFNTLQETGIKHGGSNSLGFAFCQTAASPGKMGIAFQNVYLGAPNATATFTVWAYHTNGNCPSIMCWNPGADQNNPGTAYSAGRYQWVCTDNWGQLNTWVSRSMTVTSDSSGYVTIMVGGAAHTGTSSGSRLYIDDISVQ